MKKKENLIFKHHLSHEYALKLKKYYSSILFDNIVPWWEKHSLDYEEGGYFTRLERDGKPYSGDKDVWMTGREIWMFSHLYNNFKNEARWQKIAKHGLEFLLRYAFSQESKMYFRLDRKGRPISSILTLYTEVFAAIAIAEFWKIENNPDLKRRAMEIYDRLILRLGAPSDTPMLGYTMNYQYHLHAHDMCRITIAWVFNNVWPDQRFENDLKLSAHSIVKMHWKPELNALLENVAVDGTAMLDLPEGRMFHPGHSIESAWMLMEIAYEYNDTHLISNTIDILVASLEHGWDTEYGGIRYITNIDWTPCFNLEADLKLWWPHSEALYALLFAWAITGRTDLRKWYAKVHDYTFGAFPDKKYGEWFGYLNRDGSRIWTAKANGWKGFFHIPRALFRCYQLLDQICS
jgi:N-acylglucosamine 2-epimerase